jgi:hypothetical protein
MMLHHWSHGNQQTAFVSKLLDRCGFLFLELKRKDNT